MVLGRALLGRYRVVKSSHGSVSIYCRAGKSLDRIQRDANDSARRGARVGRSMANSAMPLRRSRFGQVEPIRAFCAW